MRVVLRGSTKATKANALNEMPCTSRSSFMRKRDTIGHAELINNKNKEQIRVFQCFLKILKIYFSTKQRNISLI